MKNKFQDMQNYTVTISLTPEVYGFVNITALVGKNHSKTTYRINRTMEYKTSYTSLRDRMFAGLVAAYCKTFEMLKGLQVNNGALKNYYMVAVETGNDIPRRILSFDMYLIQANNYNELISMPDVQDLIKPALPQDGSTEKDVKHVAVYAYGYQYEHDMDAIGICHKVFHMKGYKDNRTSVIKAWNFDEDTNLEVDMDSDAFLKFVDSAFATTNRYVYNIGMTMEDHVWPHNLEKGQPIKVPEGSTPVEPERIESSESEDEDVNTKQIIVNKEPNRAPGEQIINLADMGMDTHE